MVELCIIAYVYGYSNFIDDIYEMTGSKVLLYKCDFFYISYICLESSTVCTKSELHR